MTWYVPRHVQGCIFPETVLTDMVNSDIRLLWRSSSRHATVNMWCRDNLFMPSLLEAAGKGQLRVFGNGKNKVSFTYLDNYCHGLILGYDALYKVRATPFWSKVGAC